MKNIPIIMAAFGTTSRAVETYTFMDEIFRRGFPAHDILWAYSSRMVKDRVKARHKTDWKHPHQVLSELREKGHEWAVVQSLHLICGHEFYRLLEEIRSCDIRTSVGLPLLSDVEDYHAVAEIFTSHFSLLTSQSPEALVMIGHGTDHPAWTSYPTLWQVFQERAAPVFIGMVEGGYPTREAVVDAVKSAGFGKVRLVPLMLVAGVHFEEDIMGEADSWKTAFENKGISVSAEKKGLGFYPEIVEIFCKHTRDALDIMPLTKVRG